MSWTTYNLADAVKFHRRLNPRIWGRDEHLLPEVRENCWPLQQTFKNSWVLKISTFKTSPYQAPTQPIHTQKQSDIDLHLVVKCLTILCIRNCLLQKNINTTRTQHKNWRC
jgi:hypothetical protein